MPPMQRLTHSRRVRHTFRRETIRHCSFRSFATCADAVIMAIETGRALFLIAATLLPAEVLWPALALATFISAGI